MLFNFKLKLAYISPLFFCLEIIYCTIIINLNGGLLPVIFVICAGTVILDDLFVLISCFRSYRLLFVEKPFQELPQNVFVSRFAHYWLWRRQLKSFVQKCELSFRCNVYRITLTSRRVWEGLRHIIQTINSQFYFFVLVIFNPLIEHKHKLLDIQSS